MSKFNVLHVAGGNVSEYYLNVSLIYGLKSFNGAPTEEFNHFFAFVSLDEKTNYDKWQFLERDNKTEKDNETLKREVESADCMTTDKAISYIVNNIKADVVVPHMFCYPGMTYFRSVFDLLEIPYIGSTAEMQGLMEDKWKTKCVAMMSGVRMAEGQLLTENDKSLIKIQCPLIVKPSREDNSLGVTHVKNEEQLQSALDEAFKWDDRVIVEDYIPGREIRVAIVPQNIIDNIEYNISQIKIQDDKNLVVLPFLEYLFPGDVKIRDPSQKLATNEKGMPTGQNKNTFNSTKLPSILSGDLQTEISHQAKIAYKALDCRDYCVMDFRVKKDPESGKEIPYLLELCSLASFSPESIVVRMANKSSEIGGPDLQHPRLFKGILKTSIRKSKKFRQNNGEITNFSLKEFGLNKK